MVDLIVKNLTEPIFVMLRTPFTPVYEVTPFTPVWWDSSSNNGSGGWSSEGCQFRHQLQDHVVFSCENFGYYGLLQDVTYVEAMNVGGKFKLSHPAIYVGTFILFTSFLIVILTYLLCYVSIQMPKKAKHSLINMWIAISLLCFMYVFGIYQTEDVKICQMVGMILHYFTLCSLLWMCVGVNCMYKRLSKNDIISLQDDDLPSDRPIQKPILGLYLVGWGIGLIICGLSAAINMNEYASSTHCFLRSGPALSALYIPFFILLIFIFVLFLLIRCAIYNIDTNGHLSEGTQATEHVDLDLLEPNFPNIDSQSFRSVSTKTGSSEVEDPEHAPSAQLKAHLIFLLIYIMTWLSCAFATVPPFHIVSFEEDLFSIAFAVSATTLGAFTLFFYCVARNDVRTQWVVFVRWMKRKRICYVRSRSISDTILNIPQIQIQPLPLPPVCEIDNHIISRSTSRSSSHTKSNSHASNILKGAVDLNGSFSDNQTGAKINNVNLVVLHRAQYRSNTIPNIIENPTNAAVVFYNPHQSTVARKFFKRQKRNMLKKNNLSKPPRDINSDTASVFSEPRLKVRNSSNQNIFGTNSKVNNTNIHVEHKQRIQQKNPNIFSDSADEFDSVANIPVEKMLIDAERLGKKDLIRQKMKKKHNIPCKQISEKAENNMRSISQQCTLEYSSETISDSVLDKTSPEKTLLPNQESFLTETSGAIPSFRRENSPFSILTENDPNYCQINDLRLDSVRRNQYFPKSSHGAFGIEGNKKPSELSSSAVESMCGNSTRRIYINPSHDLRLGRADGQSRASSVSVSDLDELYQQIRRGPQPKRSRNLYSLSRASPCLSDSEINSFVSDVNQLRITSHSHDDFDHFSDVETTV
nr:adhesion G protein-coupled receptor A3-like [Leptinotarsa decemlineata]